MKQVKKKIWMLAMLVMFCPMIALAQEETEEPANQEDPEVSVPEIREVSLIVGELTGGTITLGDQIVSETVPGKVEVSITVTPADGYKISKENLKLWAVIPLQETPSSSTRSPELSGELTLVGDEPEDPTEGRTYTVTIDPNLDIWVEEAEFQKVEETKPTWTLTEGVLTISGVVDVEGGIPWSADAESITSVVITDNEHVMDLVALGIPEETPVGVPGNLLNAYVFDYKGFKIDSEDKTEIEEFSFGETNSFATFVAASDMKVPSVLKAYEITNITEDGLVLREVTSIAKGEPVLVFAEEKYKEIEKFYTVTTDPVEAGSNLLRVAPKGGQPVTIGTVYMLYNDVFYYTQTGTIPEGSVYLTKPEQQRTRGFYTLGGDNKTTGIYSASLNDNGGMINEKWYDLQGHSYDTAPTRKGIYIKDGNKVVIK